MKKMIALTLTCGLLMLPVVSCKSSAPDDTQISDPQGGENPQGSDDGAGDEAAQVPERLLPNLPDETFGGYTFTFFASRREDSDMNWATPVPREFVPNEEDGEIISEAVWRRNQYIEEKYHINIDVKFQFWYNYDSDLSKAISANEDIYDAIMAGGLGTQPIQTYITRGWLLRTDYLPYIDDTQPWWDQGVKAMSIAGKNYVFTGDLMITDNGETDGMLFNKKLFDENNIPYPYDLVTSGKWTLDRLHEITRQGYKNLDGTGELNWQTDQYGLVVFGSNIVDFLSAGGGAVALKDENDIPYLTFADPRSIQILDKIFDVLYDRPSTLDVKAAGVEDQQAYWGTFEAGRALMMWARICVMERYRNMEDEFGVVPMPKFEDTQERYYSPVNPFTGVLMGVPSIAGSPERTSIILEAICADSKYTLRPAYYDVALQRKYTRDSESQAMLDIIFDNRVYDVGTVYNFNGIAQLIVGLPAKDSRDVASFYEKNADKTIKAIDKLVEHFQAAD